MTDTEGMILLSESCKGLESLKLHGFYSVHDVGFTSIFNSCLKLTKLEIQNAFFIRNLAFKNVHRSLVEVKLVSCSSITSKGVRKLVTSCTSFKVLDLFGCDLVADSCLSSISCHTLLTSLNLGGTNVTDAGMVVLELCIGNCILVTDEAMKVLAVRGRLQDESKLLRRLDIFNCPGISANYIEYLKKPFFRGLQWIGIGETRSIRIGDVGFGIIQERPWLSICKDGCEIVVAEDKLWLASLG
ncbi:F-box domain, cyclin-like protein [Tanacetum coccineum]